MTLCSTEVEVYDVMVVGSIIFTLALSLYARKEQGFANDAAKGRKVYYICGVIKVLIGILLLTVLYPKDCRNFVSAYGAVATVIGVYWLAKGKMMPNASNSTTEDAEDAHDNEQEIV